MWRSSFLSEEVVRWLLSLCEFFFGSLNWCLTPVTLRIDAVPDRSLPYSCDIALTPLEPLDHVYKRLLRRKLDWTTAWHDTTSVFWSSGSGRVNGRQTTGTSSVKVRGRGVKMNGSFMFLVYPLYILEYIESLKYWRSSICFFRFSFLCEDFLSGNIEEVIETTVSLKVPLHRSDSPRHEISFS